MQQDKFESELQEAVLPIVDDIMKENFAGPPPGLLVPETVWRENIRKELIDVCTGKQIRNRIISAQNVILNDLKSRLSSVEFEKFQADWKKGLEKILGEKLPAPEEGTLPPTLQHVMGISEETMATLYDVGFRCYKAKEFIKAADVFFFMTMVDYLRHNVWISLGLSEQQNGHFELALTAYSMAILTNADNPIGYLQSAECSLALHNAEEAGQYLDLAKEAIGKAPQKIKQRFLDQLGQLQQRSRLL